MKTRFVTYASDEFRRNAQLLAESAARSGFDAIHCLGPDSITDKDFIERNAEILSAKRGGGYWLWKPHLILKHVAHLADNEILFYCDAGRSGYYCFTHFPNCLAERTVQSEHGFIPGVAIAHLGSVGKWTKRDCLQIMQADSSAMHSQPIVQTTWSVWTRTRAALDFLEAWLRYSEDPRCITDQPNTLGKSNLPEFVDHRHDQSICSILAYQRSAPVLDPSGTITLKLLGLRPGSEVGNLFFKRPENVDDLLRNDTSWLLVREFMSLRKLR